jgi:hypothetical protein
MGSPVAFAGYIALTSQDGDTFMLKAGPKHDIVRTNSVGEPVSSSPAISNGRIYIRGQRHLFAIGGPEPPSPRVLNRRAPDNNQKSALTPN